ncbi:IclR family transcriptional regulator [Gluconacetobacter sp. Hr-1-5]|uniref:IclR family transcriptional regulator n=1 Tax=Gluconacetobacter sp. Hr-1-5 TaxID=3395370 RepID=UPI003B5252CD
MVKDQKNPGTQAIGRAFQILRIVAGQGGQGVRLTDLTAEIDLAPATIHRILQALRREGVLDQNPMTRRYQIGKSYLAMMELFSRNSFQERARQAMQDIVAALKCSAYLSVNAGGQMVCIDRVISSAAILVIPYDVGERRSLGIGAAGIALLAAEAEQYREIILKKNEGAYARYGLKVTVIREMVEECIRNGYSYNPGHFIPGIAGIGVAFVEPAMQRTAVINVAVLSHQVADAESRNRIADILRQQVALNVMT